MGVPSFVPCPGADTELTTGGAKFWAKNIFAPPGVFLTGCYNTFSPEDPIKRFCTFYLG